MFDLNNSEDLIFTGQIVQDSDNSVDDTERHQRFMRYINLIETIEGSESIEVAQLIIKSMSAQEDYGAYQDAQRALFRFPPEISTRALVLELPNFVKTNPEWVGEVLCSLANEIEEASTPFINNFTENIKNIPADDFNLIMAFIHKEEKDGWLSHRVGVLK